MTQANYRPTLALKLAAMQTPEAIESSALASFAGNNKEEAIAHNLLLHPGEPSEMLVQLENLGSHPLRWKLVIEGDFPETWCSWHQKKAEEIAPNQKVDKELSFQVPEDFFENQFALMGSKTRLQINYEAQVYVYAKGETSQFCTFIFKGAEETLVIWLLLGMILQDWDAPTEVKNQQQLIGYRVFNLCIRPNTSYLNFLPAIYREIDFMMRFLTIFEQAFDPAVQTIDVLWAYLDPLTAPEAMLPFLANWVAWPMEQRWDSKQQRRLIRNAVTLYRWHGTRRGLRYYLHLYTGLPLDEHLPESEKHISIEEIFSQGFVLGKTFIGQDSMLGGARPFHFIVSLRTNNSAQIDEKLVRDIIEREKPAFCTYDLDFRT